MRCRHHRTCLLHRACTFNQPLCSSFPPLRVSYPGLLPAFPLLQPPSPPHPLCSYSHGCLAPFPTVSPEENFSSVSPKKKKKWDQHSQAKCRQCEQDPSPLPFLPPLRLHSPASPADTPPLSSPTPPLPFALTIETALQSPQQPLSGSRKEGKGGGKNQTRDKLSVKTLTIPPCRGRTGPVFSNLTSFVG